MSEAHKAHWRVPEDLSVVGYGDIALAATETLSLTTVRQPALPIAAAGVNALVARISDPAAAFRKTLIEPVLVARSSTRESGGRAPALAPSERGMSVR
jgi:LacI family transcriptional regulator